GAELGTLNVTDTVGTVTGLEGNTDYDFYVVADCGTTPGDWGSISFTTDCGVYGLPFNETFEDDSETRICWYNINEVGTDNWTYQTGSNGGAVNTAYEGDLNARYVSSSSTSTAKLASPRIDVSTQDSVALVFAYAQQTWAGDQNITKVYKRAGDTLPWVEIASYNVDTPEWTLDTLYIADSSAQLEIAFEGTNNWGYANVVDAVEVLPCSLEPGIDGSENVCRAVETVDLNSFITAGEDFGYWSFPANESFVDGSIASVQFLPEGTHDFLYIVKTPCASDTTIASLVIYGPSSAGNDGSDTICMNEPYNLLSSLSGTIDLGGQWIDPTGTTLSGPGITGSSIPGSYNYQYVTTNGVCDADTSTVLLFVNPDCDYLGLMEAELGFFELYPNPTNGEFSIQANDAEGFFSVEVTDINGRTVSVMKNFITGNEIKSIDLSSSENGVYFIKIYNSNVFKTYRMVKN
ncbi:MAG: T9SS type A sorting domain-containing protein, partial [Bacteroidota bacterium]|nr:T9SS type A sorting domain-containing protein [Bacteroidota bacterium]